MFNDYGKGLFKPWISVQNVVLASAAIFVVALLKLTSSELASWVQAIGSIAAIMGAFALSNNQLKRQEDQRIKDSQKKSKALFAVVKHAVEHANSLKRELASADGHNKLKLAWSVGYGEIFNAAVKSLGLIPAHELGDYELVISHNHILAAMINVSHALEGFVGLENCSQRKIELFRLELTGHLLIIDNFWFRFENSQMEV